MADMKDFRCDVCLRSTCVCPRPDPEFTALVDSLNSLRSELAAEKAAHEATKKELSRLGSNIAAEVRDRLKEFAGHTLGCALRVTGFPCNCGRAALAKAGGS